MMDIILSYCACVVCLATGILCASEGDIPDPNAPPLLKKIEKVQHLRSAESLAKERKAIELEHQLSNRKNKGIIKYPYHAKGHLVSGPDVNRSVRLDLLDTRENRFECINFYMGDHIEQLLNDWLYVRQAIAENDYRPSYSRVAGPVYVQYRLIKTREGECILYGRVGENGVIRSNPFRVERMDEHEIVDRMRQGEKLIAYGYRGYLFVRSDLMDLSDPEIATEYKRVWGNGAMPRATGLNTDGQLLRDFLREWIEIQCAERDPAVNAKDSFKRAWKSYSYQFTHNTKTEIEDYVTAVPQRQYAHDLYPDNSGSKRKKELGLQDGPIHNTIPNVNEGKCTESAVQSFIKQHPGYSRTYSEGGKVSYAATVQSTGNRIDYQIAHHVNPDQAMNMLFHFIAEFPNLWSPIPESSKRYVRYTPGSGPLKSLGRVGDFDMPLKDYLTPDGMLIEGSDKSAVFFIRGNTAVGIQSVDPTVDVLPWAREIDEKLKKNLERVAERKKE